MRHSIVAAFILGIIVMHRATAQEIAPDVADVSYYGEAPPDAYAAKRCRLDLFRPEGVDGYPTVVFFHGGALRNGSRRSGDLLAERFVPEGVGIVSVDYRLSPMAECPSYIEDSAAAVAWTLDHIDEYGGDPTRVYLSGHSAGGYLSAMVGLDPKYLDAFGHNPDDLAGLLPISGQMVTHSTVRDERGIPEDRPLIDEFAPCYHVRADAPPMLAIAGSEDLPTRAEENVYLVAALHAVGHEHSRCLVIQERNHNTIYDKIAEADDPAAEAMLALIRESAR